MTGNGQPLAGIKDALAEVSVTDPEVTGKVPYLLSKSEASSLSLTKKRRGGSNSWWLRSPGFHDYNATCVDRGDVLDGDVSFKLGVRPALKLNLSFFIFESDKKTFFIKKETAPSATFTATGADTGTLSGVTAGMKYKVGDRSWTDINSSADISLTGLSACTIQVVKKGNGTTTVDSDAQTIDVTKAETPNLSVTQPAVIDGKGTVATTTAHEYSSDNGSNWTDCTSNMEFAADTYLIRVKASGTALASGNQSVTIKAFICATVTFKVVNGSWNEGEGEAATAEKP